MAPTTQTASLDAQDPALTAAPAREIPAGSAPRTSTFQLFKGGTLLATLVDGYSDLKVGWEHHRARDPDAPPRIEVPPRMGDAEWFLADCDRVWNGVEVRPMVPRTCAADDGVLGVADA